MSEKQKESRPSSSYKDAGVDIDAGDALVEAIKPAVKMTMRQEVIGGLGGFGGLFDMSAIKHYDHPVLVAATDGVGTKLMIAQALSKHQTIGIDLVAMCVNDLVVQGAEPLFFLDYFATSHLNVEEATSVIEGVAEGCVQAGCALIGGETAEMPGLYKKNDYDLAGFSVGVVERDRLLPKTTIQEGDVVLGIPSAGFHSNGFSLIRKICKDRGLTYEEKAPWDHSMSLGEALLIPTKIYVKVCLSLIKSSDIKAFAHITGGGLLENLPRILPEGLGITLDPKSWEWPEMFRFFQTEGAVTQEEMLRTFNCGIGMVAVVSAKEVDNITKILQNMGESACVIGSVCQGLDREVRVW